MIAPGTVSRIRRNAQSGIFLQVQGVSESEQEAAKEGLVHAWDAMMPAFAEYIHDVSPLIPTPDGPVIMIDAPDAPRWVHEGIPEVLTRCLHDAGVTEAQLVALTGSYNGKLWKWFAKPARSVTLRLYPPPPPLDYRTVSPVPEEWLEVAIHWVRDGVAEGESVRAAVGGIEFDTTIDAVPALWRTCREAKTSEAVVVGGDPRRCLRGANAMFFGYEQSLSLGGGGQNASDDELVATAEYFAGVARRLAPQVAQAFVTIDGNHSFHALSNLGPTLMSGVTLQMLCDEFLFDVFPWQVLGPGHVARQGGIPPGGRLLGGGRVELAVGTWQDWFPEDADRRAAVQRQGRSLLADLLCDSEMGRVQSHRRELARHIGGDQTSVQLSGRGDSHPDR